MAEVEVYRDRNGAAWTILRGGTQLTATPKVTEINYDPEPGDLGPVTAKGGDAPGSLELGHMKQLIEAWAGQHKKEIVLRVTASSGGGWVLLLALAVILAADE